MTFASLHSMIVDCIPRHCQSTAGSFVTTATSFGNLVGFLLTPILIQGSGWEWAFYYFAIAGFVFLPFWMMLDTKPTEKPHLENSSNLCQDSLPPNESQLVDFNRSPPIPLLHFPTNIPNNHHVPDSNDKTQPNHCGLPVAPDSLDSFYRKSLCCEEHAEQEKELNVTENTESQTTDQARSEVFPSESYGWMSRNYKNLTTVQSIKLISILLHRKQVLAIIICQFTLGWSQFSIISWLPRMIHDMHQVEMLDLSFYLTCAVVLQTIVGCFIGPLGDVLIHKWQCRKSIVRHLFQTLAMIPPAILFVLAYYATTAMWMVVFITVALG